MGWPLSKKGSTPAQSSTTPHSDAVPKPRRDKVFGEYVKQTGKIPPSRDHGSRAGKMRRS